MGKGIAPPDHSSWTFETAYSAWRSFHATPQERDGLAFDATEAADELAFSVAESAEVFLLDTDPVDSEQAAAIIEIVMDQPDLRIDGRDRAALRNIQSFIRSALPTELAAPRQLDA